MFKFKGTLVIVAFLIILLAYVLLVEVKNPSKEEKDEQEKVVLKIENTDKLKSLRFKKNDAEIVCEKQKNGWIITSPINAKGDDGIFNGLLANLAELKAEKKLDAGNENQASYGLDKPLSMLTITFEDGKTEIISIGNKTFDDTSYYAQLSSGKKIFTIASYIVDGYFTKSLTDLRDKTIISYNADDVVEFEFKHGEQTVRCQKDSKKRWAVLSPFNCKGNYDMIASWLSNVSNLKAKDYINNKENIDLSLYGLDKPSMDINIFIGQDKAKKSLIIGNQDIIKNCYYAKREDNPEVFLLETSFVENLYKDKIDTWRDNSVFNLPFGDMVSFEIKKADKFLTGSKDKDGNWMISKPDVKKAVSWKIENQLTGVINLKYEKLAQGPRSLDYYALDKPQIVVKITSKDGENADLLVGKQKEGTTDFYAQKDGDDKIFIVGKTLIDGLDEIVNNPPYEEKEKK